MKFSYVEVFVRQDGILYSGKWMDRFQSPKTLEDLDEVKQIQTEDRGPEVKTSWSAVYVKTPSLLAYVNGDLEKQITREVETCEILLRASPSEYRDLLWLYGDQRPGLWAMLQAIYIYAT
ncbi:hypothetical protein AnigIFM62618_011315 [Aspergillus niger]|nr:hypothetical protein AnigIFM62618_011315 [Aspergillus niger]